MAIDTIARGLVSSLLNKDGKIDSTKLPTLDVSGLQGFFPIGRLTSIDELQGKTAEEILLTMFFGITNPTFTNPSLTILCDESDSVLIAEKENTITGSLVFNRGTINPAYGTSGYRAGAATEYKINNEVLDSNAFSINFVPAYGNNSLTATVSYAAGEQPLNSVGGNYDAPYPAGQISSVLDLKAVYPIYNGQSEELTFTWFTDDSGEAYKIAVPSEQQTHLKQSFAINNNITLIGVKQYNIMSQQWEWIGGSAQASISTFDESIININNINYKCYTNNDADTAARELLIFVQGAN